LTAGELHLERCLKDLRERFAKCEIQTGQTIVPYRETIVNAPEMAAPKNPELGRGGVLAVSASKQLSIRLRVVPLPEVVTDFFTKHVGTIQRLQSEKRTNKEGENSSLPTDSTQQDEATDAAGEAREVTLLSLDEYKKELNKTFEEVREDKELWKDIVNRIIAFGPRRIGPNVLVDATAVNTCEKL
jgi:ribosome assembly protein 1